MWMMKCIVEKKLTMMAMQRIKKNVIHLCLGNGERKNLGRGDREPQRVHEFPLPFLTSIHGD
jgi:hypothetical protein